MPTNVHIGDLDGTSAWVGNKWTARVTIAVHDSNERLLANAKVTGVWSGGASSTANCTTNSAGRCTVTSPQMGSAKTSITFSVRSVQYGKLTYKPIANHDPDGDSAGKAITVRPPLFISRASSGGSILETTETSGRGADMSPTASTFNLGDDELNKQYRAILSFNTGSLPDNAVITRATLTLTSQSITGSGNPFSLLQGLIVDVRKGYFGPASTLEASDFQAVASLRGTGPYSPTPVLGVYTITLSSTSLGYINKLNSNAGLTQLRLRYKLDDNDDHSANFITFYSGYSLAAYRPRLTITYYVP